LQWQSRMAVCNVDLDAAQKDWMSGAWITPTTAPMPGVSE